MAPESGRTGGQGPVRIAVLDDYQNVSAEFADWSVLDGRAEVTVFTDHLDDQDQLVARLDGFDAICVMRERTPLTRQLLERLPRLKFISSTGSRNAAIDVAAAGELGIVVRNTGYTSHGALELTWAVILAILRQVPVEAANVRAGRWQTTVGGDLQDRTLGLLGLGRIGSSMAQVARAFGMKVIAWSPHLTQERAQEQGVDLVDKDALFASSDIVSVHLVLSGKTRGIVGAAELALMKSEAYLVNTSRGPLVDEDALIDVLERRAIAGAALDVYDVEPLPSEHRFRGLENLLATPHIGFVTRETYRIFYRDTVANFDEWLTD